MSVFLIIMLTCVTYSYFCINAVNRYLSYPASSIIEQHYVDSITFPSFTICNINRYRDSVYMNLIANGTVPDTRSFKHYLKQQIQMENTFSHLNDSDALLENELADKLPHSEYGNISVDWEEVIQKGGQQCSDMVKSITRYTGKTPMQKVESFVHPGLRRLCHTVALLQDKGNKPLQINDSLDAVVIQLDSEHDEYRNY